MRAPSSAPAADAWSTSPLSPPLRDVARELVAKLDERQRLWLSGYLAGVAAALPAAPAASAATSAGPAATVLYGSQGGNSESLARRAAEALKARGVNAAVLDMLQCTKADLTGAHCLLVVVSTYGEGDPPDSALPLWELLESRKAPSLAGKSFSVLALGDSSYQKFCETGRRFDAKLEALGATRLHPRVDCDIDFEAPAGVWIEGVVARVLAASGVASSAVHVSVSPATASVSSAYTRRNPFAAEVLVNQRLTSRMSSKNVRHIELSLAGSNIRYEPGDAIGIMPPQSEEQGDAPAKARAPRLYSIASSSHATPDEVHLTVSVAEFDTPEGKRQGLVSGMLAALEEGAVVPIYLQRNTGFRLPESDRPIIMIGPGTGVAPFRAFVAEREATGARGRNWLFFGERSFEHDFLYQVEWLAWRRSGVLTRMDAAFSRDQERKIYVQHRLLERGAEVWSWLQDGAYVYVCGDASRMAPDVHAALLQIIERHGGQSPDSAAEYLQQLQRNRRYQRDVY